MTHITTNIAEVNRSVTVRLPPQEAWSLFTMCLRDWWPLRSHSCSGDTQAQVVFEPRRGGAVTEVAPDGRHHPWGTLTEWSPPQAFAMSWHPGQPAALATHLRVTFTAVDGGTEVRVRHQGWEARGAQSQAVRDEYDRGWPLVLQSLAEAARRSGAT